MNRVFIHSNNLCDDFENRVLFAQNVELDKYISEILLPEVNEKNPDVIFIKDALSQQYIDLLGLRVAMHIRFSDSKLKLLPIVILSELTLLSLMKLSPLAEILLTKNVFLVNNTKEDIENFDTKAITPLFDSEYKEKFLDLITIEAPKDYLTHHDIANEWSIYKWAQTLAVSSDSIKENKEKIHNMLYFKYLAAKDNIDVFDIEKLKTKFENGGKIVSIDDESKNGWRDIFKNLFKYQKKIHFQSLNYDYKDKSYWALERKVVEFITKENPDVVVLDLRLSEEDHEENIDIEEISGVKLLQKIHKINAGIQVIMLTATGKSTILEKLYEYKILGYIKKEHPDDKMLNTKENIEKFISLVEKGFNNSYLKKIYELQNELLSLDIFSKNVDEEEKKLYELEVNIPMIFDTLESKLSKKFIYAMLSIYKCLEIICDYYMYEVRDNTQKEFVAYWRDSQEKITQGRSTIENKITNILQRFNALDNNKGQIIKQLVCSRNYAIHPNEKRNCQNHTVKEEELTSEHIVEWFKFLSLVIKNMKI